MPILSVCGYSHSLLEELSFRGPHDAHRGPWFETQGLAQRK